MTIIEDTRQKPDKNKFISDGFLNAGVHVVRSKLPVGDYCSIDSMRRCVDTKSNIQEIAGNLTQDHERFRRELVRAQEMGITLYILIFDEKVKDKETLKQWANPRAKRSKAAPNGVLLSKIMSTMEQKYGVKFVFGKREKAAETIIDILQHTERSNGEAVDAELNFTKKGT